MKVEISYPALKKRRFPRNLWLTVLTAAFYGTGAICILINILTGGFPWCLIVTGSLLLAWISVFRPTLIEHTALTRLTVIIITVSMFLILIDILTGGGWATMAVPIICFSLLILQGIIYFGGYKWQRRNFSPFYFTIVGSLMVLFNGIVGLSFINWPIIVLGSIAFGFAVLSLIFLRKQLVYELKKKFHV